MKRRHHNAASRRPKRMIVPSSEEESLTNVYEWDWNEYLSNVVDKRIPRPLPSSTVLASLVPASQGLDMPLLQHLKPLMKGNQEDTVDNDNKDTESPTVVEAIDDPSSSTLTKGQHARYLHFEAGSGPSNEGQRKEFRNLSQRVQQEQELYRQALEQFWEQHKNQFKVGLERNMARYCMAFAKQYQSAYHGTSLFGPCSQVISLQHVSRTAFTSARLSKDDLLLDAISSQVVYETGKSGTQVAHWQGTVPVFDESRMQPLQLLQDDSLALQLAQQHNASIVTAEETLQTLLQVSGDESTRWMIPTMKTDKNVIVLDIPMPRPTIPRECVSRGMTEGLYQSLSPPKHEGGYVYILLTLPTKAKSISKTRRVLVRCQRRLYTVDQQPLRIHVQLEYFPSRGEEDSTSFERASWILDVRLLNARPNLARVDPSTQKVLQWEPLSIAHALAVPKNPLVPTMDPMNHFEALAEFLNATETLASGRHLLCLPPGSTSVSVHKACEKDDDEAVIDVQQELEGADAVYTGAAALRRCARMWKWKDDRIPYTFPVKDETTATKGKGRPKSA